MGSLVVGLALEDRAREERGHDEREEDADDDHHHHRARGEIPEALKPRRIEIARGDTVEVKAVETVEA